jgi:hypothetical protein
MTSGRGDQSDHDLLVGLDVKFDQLSRQLLDVTAEIAQQRRTIFRITIALVVIGVTAATGPADAAVALLAGQ